MSRGDAGTEVHADTDADADADVDAVLGNTSVTRKSGRDRVVRSNALAIAETLGYRLDDVATWNGGAKKVCYRLASRCYSNLPT